MDLDNHPRTHCDPVSRDCSHHMDRLGHRGIEAGVSSFSFSLPLGSCYSKQDPSSGSRELRDGSSLVWGLMCTTRTRKYGRVAGHWDFNLEILVAYRETFLQPNSENVHLTLFIEYLICMG